VRKGGLNWQKYIDFGGILYMSKYPDLMHHKFCLIDDKILYNGSYNWTYYAEKYNIENTIKFTNERELNNDFWWEFDRITKYFKPTNRVKLFSLVEIIEWYSSSPRSNYISKDIELGLKTSSTILPKFALESLEIAIQLRKKKTNSLLSLKDKLKKKEKKRLESELTSKILTSQIIIINKKIDSFHGKRNTSFSQNKSIKVGRTLIDSKKDAIKYTQLLDSIEENGFQGEFGELRINLKWNTRDDLDLHVFDPCKNHIHYAEMKQVCRNSVGLLDVDANANTPLTSKAQENIFWKEKPPIGTYSVFVTHFSLNQNKEVPFVLSIVSKHGKSKVILGKVHKLTMETVKVASFEYARKKGVTEIHEDLIKSSLVK
jgi:hypothetical protein